MFKRKAPPEREYLSDPFVRKEDPTVTPFKDRASLLQRTLSSAALYHSPKEEEDEEPLHDMIIGEGVSVSGEICFEKTLRIDGEFKGELLSDGRLIVGPQGRVNCHVNLASAAIEGHVTGNITVSGTLELLGNARVYGDISASSLVVGPGVTLIGQVCVKHESRSTSFEDDTPSTHSLSNVEQEASY